jgi:hypothetical protein
MVGYQIRTPPDMVFDDFIRLMTDRAKEVLRVWNVFASEPSDNDWNRFKQEIGNAITPYLKNYSLCGVSSVCLDHARRTTWSINESHSLNATPRDMVYQLFPRKELEAFLEELVTRAYEVLKSSLKSAREEDVHSLLRVIFRSTLGDFLYFNPDCGHTELCTYSVLAHSSPWWHSR